MTTSESSNFNFVSETSIFSSEPTTSPVYSSDIPFEEPTISSSSIYSSQISSNEYFYSNYSSSLAFEESTFSTPIVESATGVGSVFSANTEETSTPPSTITTTSTPTICAPNYDTTQCSEALRSFIAYVYLTSVTATPTAVVQILKHKRNVPDVSQYYHSPGNTALAALLYCSASYTDFATVFNQELGRGLNDAEVPFTPTISLCDGPATLVVPTTTTVLSESTSSGDF